MGRWFTLLSVTSTLLLCGCQSTLPSCETPAPAVPSEYALVEYRLREKTDTEPKVEVSDTATYRAEHARYTAAALRLPDACVELDATGAPALKAECKPWLAELERAFAAASFRMAAWDSLWRLEREKGLSTYNAAKELGAEIVFVLNTLESESVTAGNSKLPKHEYFASDERGGRGEPLSLDEGTRSAFLKYTLDAASKSIEPSSVIALTAVLDSTAIVTQTGESIWFYRRATVVPTKEKQGLKLLFGRVTGGGWTPAAPVVDADATSAPPAPEAGAASNPPDIALLGAERLELVRASADHLVTTWKSGELPAPGSGGSQP